VDHAPFFERTKNVRDAGASHAQHDREELWGQRRRF
jgi:hypothetical protein